MTTLDTLPQTTQQTMNHTAAQATPMVSARLLTITAMTLVLLLAAAFRVYHITQQSIWFDEAFAWNIVMQPDMFPRIVADTHPPLYYLLLRGWVGVAGDSPLALRYLSALTSLLTVAFVYRVGVEITAASRDASQKVGQRSAGGEFTLWTFPVLAALVLALSDAEAFLAQETRNYALYSGLATLSMWAYLRWLRIGNGRMASPSMLVWIIANTALMYTHYQGAFIPAVQGLHALLFLRGRQRLTAIGGLAAVGVLFLPWFVAVTIPQYQRAIERALPYAIPSNWETLLALRDSYLGAMWPLLLALVGVGVWWLASGRDDIRRNILQRWSGVFLVVMWFALPFGVLFFGNFFADLLTERKLLIVAPAIALLVGAGLAALDNPARWILAGALVIYGASAVDYYRVKESWEQIAGTVVPYVQETDTVMVEAGVGQYPVKYYWSRTLPEGVYLSTFPFLGDETMAPTTDRPTYFNGLLPEVLATTTAQRTGDVATAWLVYWSQDRTVLERLHDAGYQRTMTITHNHLGNAIDVYRYDDLEDIPPSGSYTNGMTLRAAEIDADRLRVDLWWDQPDDAYTTSVLVLDAAGNVVAQKDSPPPAHDSAVIYDGKLLELSPHLEMLPPGEYTVVVQVYRWSPEGITNFTTLDGDPWITIGMIETIAR